MDDSRRMIGEVYFLGQSIERLNSRDSKRSGDVGALGGFGDDGNDELEILLHVCSKSEDGVEDFALSTLLLFSRLSFEDLPKGGPV